MLDLDQNTLPGIAHLLVETMIISDQIRAEDRANVLRALLLKHRSEKHTSILQTEMLSTSAAVELTLCAICVTRCLYRLHDSFSMIIFEIRTVHHNLNKYNDKILI